MSFSLLDLYSFNLPTYSLLNISSDIFVLSLSNKSSILLRCSSIKDNSFKSKYLSLNLLFLKVCNTSLI